MAPFMVLINANMRDPCFDIDLDKKLVLKLVLLMMLWTEIKMVCWRKRQSRSHMVHLIDFCLALMKASCSALLMMKSLVLH